ncbi:MAG: hypothetical protein RL490_983 [Pseudomonadota bacterium]|jgi:hypothetical protein
MTLLLSLVILVATAAVYALVATIIGERADDLWLALTGRPLAAQAGGGVIPASRCLNRA